MSDITQKWVSILKPFTGNYGGRLSGTELSRLAKVPQQSASRILNGLVRQNILEYSMQGRNKLFYFDNSKQSTRSIFQIIENQKSLDFQKKAKEAFPAVNDMLNHAESLIVFGSYSSYTFDKSSDLDIAIVGKCSKEEIRRVKKRQTIQVNEHYASWSEFSGLLVSKNPLVVEILKNHILFGDVSRLVEMFLEATR